MYKAEKFIWAHPQTGFKEWIANDYLKEKYRSLGFQPVEAGNIPGFYFDINTGKNGPAVAILAELDSIILPEHPECDPQTKAVHACGHNCQSAALLGVAAAWAAGDTIQTARSNIRNMQYSLLPLFRRRSPAYSWIMEENVQRKLWKITSRSFRRSQNIAPQWIKCARAKDRSSMTKTALTASYRDDVQPKDLR